MEKERPRGSTGSPSSAIAIIMIMHLCGIALTAVDNGNLQEDYHSVAANPSFGEPVVMGCFTVLREH